MSPKERQLRWEETSQVYLEVASEILELKEALDEAAIIASQYPPFMRKLAGSQFRTFSDTNTKELLGDILIRRATKNLGYFEDTYDLQLEAMAMLAELGVVKDLQGFSDMEATEVVAKILLGQLKLERHTPKQ